MNTQITRWNPFREMDEIQNRMASILNWDALRPTTGKE